MAHRQDPKCGLWPAPGGERGLLREHAGYPLWGDQVCLSSTFAGQEIERG
jgi:hypothetical protein